MKEAEYERGARVRVAFTYADGDMERERIQIVRYSTCIKTEDGAVVRVYMVADSIHAQSTTPVGEGEIVGRAE